MSRLFASGGQVLELQHQFLPVNIQGWYPLGWTGLISSQGRIISLEMHVPVLWLSMKFTSISSRHSFQITEAKCVHVGQEGDGWVCPEKWKHEMQRSEHTHCPYLGSWIPFSREKKQGCLKNNLNPGLGRRNVRWSWNIGLEQRTRKYSKHDRDICQSMKQLLLPNQENLSIKITIVMDYHSLSIIGNYKFMNE